MKKLVALLCAVLLMMVAMVSAFASESITKPDVTGVDDTQQDAATPDLHIEVRDVNPDAYAVAALRDIVNRVNAEMAVEDGIVNMTTVRETVEALEPYFPVGTTIDDNGVVTVKAKTAGEQDMVIDLNEFSFITVFKDLVSTDGDDGTQTAARVTLKVDALRGATSLEGYMILVINTVNGETHFVDISDNSTFDSSTGTISVQFPTLGAFALIQK